MRLTRRKMRVIYVEDMASIWKNLLVDVADSILKLVLGHVPKTGKIPGAPREQPTQ